MTTFVGHLQISYGAHGPYDSAAVYSDGGTLFRYASPSAPGRSPQQREVDLRKGDEITLGEQCPHGGHSPCTHGHRGTECVSGFHARSGPSARVLNDTSSLVRLLGVPVRVTPGDGGRPYPAYQVEGCDASPALYLGSRSIYEASSLGGQPLSWEICEETEAHRLLLKRLDDAGEYTAPPAA